MSAALEADALRQETRLLIWATYNRYRPAEPASRQDLADHTQPQPKTIFVAAIQNFDKVWRNAMGMEFPKTAEEADDS